MFRSRNQLLKNCGLIEFKAIVWKLDNQDTGCWLLDAGKWSRFALLLFIRSTEYLVDPVSSIQHLGRLRVQRVCPNKMAQL
jgi:hypothetical protein